MSPQQPSVDEICLRVAVFKESGNQSLEGIKATRQTIRNRARKRGKKICSVVKEPQQFSFYKRGSKLRDVKIPKKFLQRYAKASTMPNVVSRDHEFFHHTSVRPVWAARMKCRKIDDHYYCKLNKEK
jgi:spore germination cell wall hydrolase CwlJ-like protein